MNTSKVEKIHFVTGKGGVGKTTLALALARVLAKATLKKAAKNEEDRVLLTELADSSSYADLLGLKNIGINPSPTEENLSLSQWNRDGCLREYALHLLKVESLYKLFFLNPVSKALIDVAPGLAELAILGKATSSPRHHGPAVSYRQAVIDSYSTGHFLNLLRAPSAMAKAISYGPMAEQSKSIHKWICNSDFTQIHIVCLSDDLVISETIELYKSLKKEFGLTANIYLNKQIDLDITDTLASMRPQQFSSVSSMKEFFQLKIKQHETAKLKLHKNKMIFKTLPFVFDKDLSHVASGLAQKLSGYLHADRQYASSLGID